MLFNAIKGMLIYAIRMLIYAIKGMLYILEV
jgi:hypothetical protein